LSKTADPTPGRIAIVEYGLDSALPMDRVRGGGGILSRSAVRSIKPIARAALALGASLASVLLGYLLLGYFIMVTLTLTGILVPTGGESWFAAVYYLTHSGAMLLLVCWAALVLVLGAWGFALAERDPRRRSSGMAARFALGGLVGGVIDLLLIAILLIVGWSRH
jgi:hypothetical protein